MPDNRNKDDSHFFHELVDQADKIAYALWLGFFRLTNLPEIPSLGMVIVVKVSFGLFSTVPKNQAKNVERLLANHVY